MDPVDVRSGREVDRRFGPALHRDGRDQLADRNAQTPEAAIVIAEAGRDEAGVQAKGAVLLLISHRADLPCARRSPIKLKAVIEHPPHQFNAPLPDLQPVLDGGLAFAAGRK